MTVPPLVLLALTPASVTGTSVASNFSALTATEWFFSAPTRMQKNCSITTCGGFRLLVLPVKLASPAYSAVMLFVPGLSKAVLKLAAPLTRMTGSPAATPFVRNCTEPVGVPAPGATAVRLAVNVTLEPAGEGLADE